MESISRKDVKEILKNLNGGLSFRLHEYKCSPRLLEFCFDLKSEKGHNDNFIFAKNIERIREFSYIDSGLFSDALANCLLRKPEEEALNILLILLPVKGSKTFVSAKCFAKTIELYIERMMFYSDAIRIIRFVFENTLLEQLQHFPDDYLIELIDTLNRLIVKFPESLTESNLTSFIPLTRSNNLLQFKSVELITRVLKNRPIVLCSQIALIFAQLKGDFLRLKHEEKAVIKDAVKGLLKLFSKILKLSIDLYSNYCDSEMISKVKEWVVSHLKLDEETRWLQNDQEIIHGLLLIASVFTSSNVDDFEVASVVIEFTNNLGNVHFDSLLGYFLNLITNDPEQYKLFFGSIEKCLHELNIQYQDHSKFSCARKLFPLIKIIVDGKKNEFHSDAIVFLAVKTIVFSEYFGKYCNMDDFDLLETQKEVVKFTQLAEYFAKMYWRSSETTQDLCMKLMLNSLMKKSAMIPSQILQTVRAILECSEIKISNSEHQTLLIRQVQIIVKEFLLDDNFDVRLECGIVLGSIVKLFDFSDIEAINDLFEQSMKHAMKSVSSKEQKSRVCYIMGIVALKANLENEHIKVLDLTSNALVGLIASWNRENNFETKGIEREIASASIFGLAYYIEKCGCYLNAQFYRDSCELLLEQVFMKDRNELIVMSVKELAKSLALYVNLLPDQSEFITKTIRLLLECGYLCYYGNDCIDLLLEISEFNPQITTPSALIYGLLRQNLASHLNGSFASICQYLNLQISFNSQISYDLIDSGYLMFLLERANNSECFDKFEFESLSFLVEKLMNLTIIERFDYWTEIIFEPLNLSGGERISTKYPADIELSSSAFSLTGLKDILKPSLILRPSTVLMILVPLSQKIDRLIDIDFEQQQKFLNFAVKICFNISVEKVAEREFFLTGIILFRGIVRTFSTIFDDNGVYILEPFDSQIVSIISSALRSSEEGDPLYAACSFGSLFSLVSNRKDLHEDLKNGSGRVFNLVKKALTILKEQNVFWTVEVVENLILLSIIIGFCSLKQSGFELSNLDGELDNILIREIGNCLVAFNLGTLEKNVRSSLSRSDRLLLIGSLLNSNVTEMNSEVIDGVIHVLLGITLENFELVCQLSALLFKFKSIETASSDLLIQLLQQISSFGLERNDPLVFETILPLFNSEKYKFLALEFLNKLSNEFLGSRFNDFDTSYGLAAVNAQQLLLSDQQDQTILFGILKSKKISLELGFNSLLLELVGRCLNDLEVNNCNDILKALKSIFTNPQVSKDFSNDLLIEWIGRLEEIESFFLNQLVFFSISSQPQIWIEETFKKLREHFEKMSNCVNSLEMALDSWILLLKAQSKNSEVDSVVFDKFVNNCTEQVSGAFEKYRGDGIDPVWERIFGIAQAICNSSEKDLTIALKLSAKALEELNDFK
jgi:hypothetical protein